MLCVYAAGRAVAARRHALYAAYSMKPDINISLRLLGAAMRNSAHFINMMRSSLLCRHD